MYIDLKDDGNFEFERGGSFSKVYYKNTLVFASQEKNILIKEVDQDELLYIEPTKSVDDMEKIFYHFKYEESDKKNYVNVRLHWVKLEKK